MAAIVANKVKRERQLRESKASIDTSIQQLHQRGSCKGRESDQDNLQLQTKMMYYKQVRLKDWINSLFCCTPTLNHSDLIKVRNPDCNPDMAPDSNF